MTLSDFRKLQAVKDWKRFVYLSENQPNYSCTEPLKVEITFYSMNIPPIPWTTIYFGEKGNRLWINFVSNVECEPNVLGDILTITDRGGQQYIIVAQ